MNIELTPHEARVIGCLVEKQLTTPEQYPLSLNALTNACNQKSNRDPVFALSEAQVQAVIDGLTRSHLVLERSGFGSRVPKYQQRFCNTEFSVFQFSPQERAILCELLLRGPQTPGELRSRAARMAPIADVSEVEAALESLQRREGGALVARLAREPGRRESRYAHLLGGAIPGAGAAATDDTAGAADAVAMAEAAREQRPASAEADVLRRLATLERDMDELRLQLRAVLERHGGGVPGN